MRILFLVLTVCSSHRNQLLELLDSSSSHLPSLMANSLLEARTASHHDRRRSHDSAQPCESKDPPDTNDSDCVATRWNLIVQYFPIHTRLIRWDTKLVTAQVATENLSDSILRRISRNWVTLFGQSKRGKKVQRNSLVGQTLLLKKVVGLIEKIMLDDSLKRAEWVLGNMTDDARHDSAALKWNLLDASTALLNNTWDIMENSSEPNFFRNRDQMNRDATLFINQTVNNLTLSLRVVRKRCDEISKALGRADTRASKLLNRIGLGIDKLGEKMFALASRIQGAENKAHENLMSVLTGNLGVVKSKNFQVSENLQSRLEEILKEINGKTDTEISEFGNSMGAFIGRNRRTIETSIDSLNHEVDEIHKEFEESSKRSARSIKGEISNSTNQLATSQKDIGRIRRDQDELVDTIADNVDKKSRTFPSTTTSLIDAGMFAQEKARDIFAKLVSSGNMRAGSALNSMINELANMASTGAGHVDDRTEKQLLRLAQQLDRLGSASSGIAGGLGEIGSRLASSSTDVNRVISNEFENFRNSGNRVARSVMEDLDNLGWFESGGQSGTELDEALTSGSEAVRDSIHQTEGIFGKNIFELHHGINRSSSKTFDQLRSIVSILGQLMEHHPQVIRTESGDPLFDSLAKLITVTDENISGKLEQVSNDFQHRSSDELRSQLVVRVPDTSSRISELENGFDRNLANLGSTLSRSDAVVHGLEHSARGVATGLDSVQDDFSQQLVHVENIFNLATKKGVTDSLPVGYMDALEVVENEAANAIKSRKSFLDQDEEAAQVTMERLGKELNEVGLDNLVKEESGLVDFPSDNLPSLMDSISETIAWGRAKFHEANSSLNSLRSSTSEFLSNITSGISSQLVRIPSVWSTREIQVMHQFGLASTQLERQIFELREKMALETTASQREALAQQLVVAERLKGVQEGISLSLSNLTNPILNQHILDSMQVLTIAVSSLSGPNPYVQATRDSVADTASETATLINGYKFIVGSTSERLSQDAAQAALDQAFAVTQNDVSGQAGWGDIWKDLTQIKTDVIDHNFALTTSAQTNASSNIANLSDIASIASSSVSEYIEYILDNMEESKLVIGSPDELTALALVRQATQQFIALWFQYGSMMNRKLTRIELGDKAWILNSRLSAAKELDELTNPYTIPLAALNELGTQTAFALNDSVSFFNEFQQVVNDSRRILGSIHRLATDKTNQANLLVNRALNESSREAQSTLSIAERVLNDFDSSE